jgi:hypothetical protein
MLNNTKANNANAANLTEAQKTVLFECSFLVTQPLQQLFSRYEGSGGLATPDLYDLTRAFVNNGCFSDTQKEFLIESLKDRYVVRGLAELNLKLSPIVYASQDYSNEIGKAYAKFVRSVSSTVNKVNKEKYDEFA